MSDENVENSESTAPKFLEPWVKEVVLYIERCHSVTGAIPPDSDIMEYLKLTKKIEISKGQFKSLKHNELFLKSLETRGLYINTAAGELRAVTSLNDRQMTAVATITNYMDRRSDEKKLRDLGISTIEWSTWMQDNAFVEYLTQRTEQMLANATSQAHLGLLNGVRQGNTASIKLYYEMTGRYNPNEENQVNIRLLIGKVLEAIQEHVTDPDTLNRLAIRLSSITMESGAVSYPPVGRSAATSKEITSGESAYFEI